MCEVLCNQSNVVFLFYPGRPLCGWQCSHCPPVWVVKELGSSRSLGSVSISTVIAPQFQPNQDSAAALTSGRGPGSCGTVSLGCRMARSSWLHAFVGNVRRSWRFLKWPEGLSMRQEAHVYKITKKKKKSRHTASSLLFTLLHCNPTDVKLQARMLLKWWRCDGLSPCGFSVFHEGLCFPLAELELFTANLTMTKQSMRACSWIQEPCK